MAYSTNEFGLNVEDIPRLEEEQEESRRPSNVKTAEWLRDKYNLERELDFKGGMKGYAMTRYSIIAEKIRGIQPGMIGLLAKSNIGKTTLLTSMMVDIIMTGLLSGDPVKCVFYTFDDSRDDMRWMIIADMAQVFKNRVDHRIASPEEAERVKKAYDNLAAMADKDLFVMKDFEDINTIEELVEDIKSEKEQMLRHGATEKLCVFLDGQGNLLSSNQRGIRELNVHKANEIRKVATINEIPIILTLETPTIKNIWRPRKEDCSESVKYAFNCKVILALSPIDNKTEIDDGDPIINIEFVKNKYSGFKGTLFAYRKGYHASFKMATPEQNISLYNRSSDYDLVFLKAGSR